MKTKLTAILGTVALALIWALGRQPEGKTELEPRAATLPPREARSRRTTMPLPPTPLPRQLIVDGVAPTPASRAAGEGFDPALAAILEVLVVAEETGAPIPGVDLWLTVGEGETRTTAEWIGGEGRRRPTTDERGGARFLLTPDAPIRIRVSIRESGANTNRDLEPIASGESFTVRLELPTQPDAHFVGRVVEAESGHPISGALVRFLDGTPHDRSDAPSTSNGTVKEIRTGPEGWFEAPLATWIRQCGSVEAEGFGPKLFLLDASHGSRERALVVRLQKGATLRGLIQGAPDFAGLLVHVEARGYEFSEGKVMSSSNGDLHRQASVARDGTWVIADLPPVAGLKVELRRGDTLVRVEPERQFLQPGEERSLEWFLGAGAAVHGRAIIADTGEPLASRSIWLLPWNKVRGLLATYHQPVARTTTDDGGSFSFSDVPPGEWAVGPEPLVHHAEGDEVAPMATRVSIEEGVWSVTVELRLHRGLFITGEVLGPDGQRVESVSVYAFGQESNTRPRDHATAGTFRIGPLVPDSYQLTARGGAGTSSSEPVTVLAGDVDVVLQLNAGGTMQGRLVNAATGEPLHGVIQVSNEESPGHGISKSTRPDGSFSFSGLPFGTYRATGSSSDLMGSIGGIAVGPSQTARQVEVPLEPGAALLITYTGEQAYVSLRARSEKLWRDLGSYERGSSARTVWPAGEIVVSMSYKSADGETHTVERTVYVVVGEETVVELRDE